MIQTLATTLRAIRLRHGLRYNITLLCLLVENVVSKDARVKWSVRVNAEILVPWRH